MKLICRKKEQQQKKKLAERRANDLQQMVRKYLNMEQDPSI